ncbi:DUF4423 domain-containing protein [Bdellovibrio sp. HCB337]|uniref:DUF4423 domain-containing protein n=1 Tax=Bdellovibrio sp. HCB337 TaxID=3394358 RepID=UPI0039A600CA
MTEHDQNSELVRFLKDKIAEIQSRNSRMSLRSISMKVGISAGRMADLTNGKRPLSQNYAQKIAKGLRLNKEDRIKLLSLVSVPSRKRVVPRVLTDSEISQISAWENYAILSLLNTIDFESSEEWIAQRLGISVERARVCVQSMLSLGLLQQGPLGLERANDSVGTPYDIPSKAVQECHRQDILKALDVLGKVSPKVRDFSSATMAVDISNFSEAKKLIVEFQQQMMRLLESGHQTEVYNLNVQLFPVTEIQEGGLL